MLYSSLLWQRRRIVVAGLIVASVLLLLRDPLSGDSNSAPHASTSTAGSGLIARANEQHAIVQSQLAATANACDSDPTLCAFAAMLCDDELLPALRVLIYSLRETASPHPFAVLVLPSVTDKAKRELEVIADVVIPVDQLAYPYEGKVKFETGINKQCRYSKLHLWAQTQYKRIIYVDVDTSVQKSIDHLFKKPATFAGVRDLGDVYNTGVLILEPSKAVSEDMLDTYLTAPSYNRGDQGFLNWYFGEHNNTGVQSLPPAYNVPAKLKGFAIGKKLIEDAFVHHFTAETKPWSFYKFYHGDWKLNYHPRMFAKWRMLDYKARTNPMAQLEEYGVPEGDSRLSNLLREYKWPNVDRQYDLCSKYDPRYETNGKFPIADQYSIAISFYNPERLQYLPRLVNHYLMSPKVHTVYITWHSSKVPVPPPVKELVKTGRFKILKQATDTLNNRFNPIPGLKTKAVFICDDDIFMPMQSLDFAFDVWRARPDSLVGYFPRIHGFKEDGTIFYEMAGVHHKYDIILTKAMFVNADFLHAYTCVLPPEIHRYVDMGMNCEDIAMNMMTSGMSGQAPVCIAEDNMLDFGTSKGISISSAFTARRDQCTADLIELFTKDTLISSREFVGEFRSNKFRKTPWDELDDVLASERKRYTPPP